MSVNTIARMLFWLLVTPVIALAQMSHEETVVRAAYAKLSFASEQVAVAQLAMEATGLETPKALVGVPSDQRMADTQLQITLSDFVVGNVSDIVNRKAIDLINPATTEQLYIHEGYHSYVADKQEYQWYEPQPRWIPAPQIPAEMANVTFGEFLDSQWAQKQPWTKYASYTVVATFQGKNMGPHKALFLFGQDAKGAEMVEPEDGIVDAVGLARAMSKHLLADALVSSRLRDVPLVKTWVSAKQQSLNCSEEQGVCCDLASVHCGPSQKIVAKGGAQ